MVLVDGVIEPNRGMVTPQTKSNEQFKAYVLVDIAVPVSGNTA